MRVLILRPEPGNAATAEAVAAMGLTPARAPLFDIVPVAWDPPDPARFDAVAMTSANAARHGGAGLSRYTHLPLYAVGETTAAAARDAGFGNVVAGHGGADDLAALATGKALLHLTGGDHRSLANAVAIVVYASRTLDAAPLPSADIALVHSPRAGARLAELVDDRAALDLVAISASAAAACGPGWRSVHTADTPRDASMLATLASLCEARTP